MEIHVDVVYCDYDAYRLSQLIYIHIMYLCWFQPNYEDVSFWTNVLGWRIEQMISFMIKMNVNYFNMWYTFGIKEIRKRTMAFVFVCGWPEGLGLVAAAASGLLAAVDNALQNEQVLPPLFPQTLIFLCHTLYSLWIKKQKQKNKQNFIT